MTQRQAEKIIHRSLAMAPTPDHRDAWAHLGPPSWGPAAPPMALPWSFRTLRRAWAVMRRCQQRIQRRPVRTAEPDVVFNGWRGPLCWSDPPRGRSRWTVAHEKALADLRRAGIPSRTLADHIRRSLPDEVLSAIAAARGPSEPTGAPAPVAWEPITVAPSQAMLVLSMMDRILDATRPDPLSLPDLETP